MYEVYVFIGRENMRISKTRFKELSRCEKAFTLWELHDKKYNSDLTIYDLHDREKYRQFIEEKDDYINSMYDEDGNDVIVEEDEHLNMMMPYFKAVEKQAIKLMNKYYNYNMQYQEFTKYQQLFIYKYKDNDYYTYVDGYHETEDEIVILEVKSSTTRKLTKTNTKYPPLFEREGVELVISNEYAIAQNNEELNKDANYIELVNYKSFLKMYEKIFDKSSDYGRYFYDLAITSYIVKRNTNKKVKFYLALLNCDFVLEEIKNDEYISADDEEVINFIDCTKFLEEYDNIINEELENLNNIIEKSIMNTNKIKFKFTQCIKPNECAFFGKSCFEKQAKTSKDGGGILELYRAGVKKFIREGIDDFVDEYEKIKNIPKNLLIEPCHLLQYKCATEFPVVFNVEEITKKMNLVKYPIYHLDFESLSLPLPRFKGETCFTQSLFQYSLHIENENDKCLIRKDNIQYIVSSFDDEREALTKSLCKNIDLSKGGCIMVYNKTFEKSRIKDLISYFPQYSDELNLMLKVDEEENDVYIIDLADFFHEGKKFYYYNSMLRGSFSLKKILPALCDLDYDDLEIQNGNMAMNSYMKFKDPAFYNTTIEYERDLLKKYCGMDTWAMVKLLDKLRKLIKKFN